MVVLKVSRLKVQFQLLLITKTRIRLIITIILVFSTLNPKPLNPKP